MVKFNKKKIVNLGNSYCIIIPRALVEAGIININESVEVEIIQKDKNAFFVVLPQKIRKLNAVLRIS
jgi:antitoxin component of MazEF toxin-antitoxin module